MYLIDFIHDFETRSAADLKEVGSVKYAVDPTTDATLLTYCFGRTGTIRVWRKGEAIPAELMDVLQNPERYRFVAWNIQFDYLIWTCVFAKGFRRPPLENLDDGMALSCHYRTGASLEAAAKMMGLSISKDKDGRTLMLKQCKPRNGKWIELTPEEWEVFTRYGVMDTRILRDVYYMLPALPEMERWAWEWTFRRNLRGILVDEALVDEMHSIIQETLPKLVAEFDMLVGYKCKMNSPVKCKEFFKQYYPWIQNLQADTVRDMLAEDPKNVPPEVRRALEIKDLAGSTSIAKIPTILNQKHMGRVYGILAYHYTHTKRWAGRGPQIQNFPRVDRDLMDSVKFDMNIPDLAGLVRSMRPGLKDPVGFVKNLLRRVWIPTPGNHFYCGDFSKVEPCVLFWLVGLGSLPAKWYEELAAEVYSLPLEAIGKESEERQVGKMGQLLSGYGGGKKSFRTNTYKATGIMLSMQMAKQVVDAYRRKYPQVTQFWKDLEIGFRKAIYGESSRLCDGKIFITPMQYPWKGVQIRLPSGSYLYYHQAHEYTKDVYESIGFDEWGDKTEISSAAYFKLSAESQRKYVKKFKKVLRYLSDQGQGRIDWDEVYSGLLCENVVSATARDVLVPAMWRLENAGFDVLGVVHDEVWGDAAPGRDEEFKRLMCINPSWCSMEIGASLESGLRYLK